ncbi:alcohol dehydrogenase [Bordetella genomosp. 10]|uniref:Alcohol dehydrogenase n=1 Tax=Bordetella genomosp. 10 TaxID=1416804 RepID=A0A261SCF2_9BORD|nr:cytochrome c [Bordetella genomosp. 10]OZI34845.1 alcohol dehydrogenase [Bordetella genomosp. 10]
MLNRYALATLVLAGATAATAAWSQSPAQPAASQAPAASSEDQQLIARGAYLAKLGDCVACHTAEKGKPFAGGLGFDTPVGKIYSTNITPDKDTGIGSFTLEDFDNAVRHGIGKDGSTLYPAMPYPNYAKIRPSDVKALYAYFMHGVQPVSQANKDSDITWPLSMRWPLSIWRHVYAPDVATDDAPADKDAVVRGKYLVEGLGHCSACHTPRGVGYQEKALSDDDTAFLSGGVIDNYLAKNLRGDITDGLGKWTEADIVAFLKSGRNDHTAAFGGMSDVVEHSLQYASDEDLTAIAKYLKTLKPVDANAKALAYDDATSKALVAGSDRSNGALTFVDNCMACHRSTGKGYAQTFPVLAQNSAVNSADPTSLISIVLRGGEMPSTTAAPTHYGMPAFDDRLTNQDIADVLTFVRSSWGNKASAVTVDQVAKIRKDSGAAPEPKR